MADRNRIAILVELRDEASRQFAQLDDRLAGAGRSFSNLAWQARKAALALSLVSAVSVKLAADAARTDAVYAGLDRRMRGLGSSAQEMQSQLRKASQGMISDAKLVQGANQAMIQIGDHVANRLPRLMQVAIRASRELGVSQEYAWDSLVQGIAKVQPFLLDNIGITTRLTEATQSMADSLGVATSELSKAQQQMALMNEVERWAAQAFGDLSGEMEGFDVEVAQLQADLKNLKEDIGRLLIPSLEGLITTIDDVIGALRAIPSAGQEAMLELGRMVLIGVAGMKVLGGTVVLATGAVLGLAAAYKAVRVYASELTDLDRQRNAEILRLRRQMPELSREQLELLRPDIAGGPDFAQIYREQLQDLGSDMGSLMAKITDPIWDAIPGLKEFSANLEQLRKEREFGKPEYPATVFGSDIEQTTQALQNNSQAAAQNAAKLMQLANIQQLSGAQLEATTQANEKNIAFLKMQIIEAEAAGESTEGLAYQLEQAEFMAEALGLRLDFLGGSQRGAAAAAQQHAFSIQELASAFAASHPLVLSLQASIAGLQSQMAGIQAAQRGMAAAMHNASRALQRATQHASNLSKQLSEARQRLQELTDPKLKGMTAIDEQIVAVQNYMAAVKLARLTGQDLPQMGGMIANVEWLERQLEILRLRKEVEFGPQLREIEKAAAGVPEELEFEEVMRQIAATKEEIAYLEVGVSRAEGAVKAKQGAIQGLQEASFALSQTAADLNAQLQLQQKHLELVTEGLKLAFTWFANDRDEMVKLGVITQEQAATIDEKLRTMLGAFTTDTKGKAKTTMGYISGIMDEVKLLVSQAKSMYSGLTGGSSPGRGYQHGTSYVPRTGMYMLHEGEEVTPRANAGRLGGGISVGNLTIQAGAGFGGSDYEMRKTARRFIKILREEQRRTVGVSA